MPNQEPCNFEDLQLYAVTLYNVLLFLFLSVLYGLYYLFVVTHPELTWAGWGLQTTTTTLYWQKTC